MVAAVAAWLLLWAAACAQREQDFYDFKAVNIRGKLVSLEKYRGSVSDRPLRAGRRRDRACRGRPGASRVRAAPPPALAFPPHPHPHPHPPPAIPPPPAPGVLLSRAATQTLRGLRPAATWHARRAETRFNFAPHACGRRGPDLPWKVDAPTQALPLSGAKKYSLGLPRPVSVCGADIVEMNVRCRGS
jgi:hypothetical protein